MITHRQRREFPAGEQFSFASPIQRDTDDKSSLDQMGHAKADDLEVGTRARRVSFNLHDNSKHDTEEEFICLPKEDDDSGTPSPPLWKNTSLLMTQSAGSSPMHKLHSDKQVYPTSRAQEIARYRQEMLDLVRDMPESGYELSLRDMVEVPRIAKTVQETIEKRREEAKKKAEKAKDKRKGMRRLFRNESLETGLFLKTFVPISLGGGRRKSSGGSNTCAKVSPKPVLAETEKGGEEEWWNRSDSSGKGSSSSSSSNSKGSSESISRIESRKKKGCYAFLLSKKSRSKET